MKKAMAAAAAVLGLALGLVTGTARSAGAADGFTLFYLSPHAVWCVDDPASNTADHVKIILWSCNGNPNQWFRAVPTTFGGQYSQLELYYDTSKCIDDPGDSAVNGTQLQVYRCNGTAAQAWFAAPITNGSIGWTNPNGKAINDYGGQLVNGAKIAVYTYVANWAEDWCGPTYGGAGHC